MGHQHDDSRVVMREAAMLRHLLRAAGTNDADIRRHDDIGRARTFGRRRIAEHQIQIAAVEEFAAAGADYGGIGFKRFHRVQCGRWAVVGEPEQGNIVLERLPRTDVRRAENRRRRLVGCIIRWNTQNPVRVKRRLAMLGGDDDRGILLEPAFLELGYEFAYRRVGELDFVDQSRGWRAATHESSLRDIGKFRDSF